VTSERSGRRAQSAAFLLRVLRSAEHIPQPIQSRWEVLGEGEVVVALGQSGKCMALAAVWVLLMSGCAPYDYKYERVSDTDQYVAHGVLAAIQADHLSQEEVVDRLGEIYPPNIRTSRSIGILRCALPGVAVGVFGASYVRDCQMIGVWFDQSGHAIEVQSLQGLHLPPIAGWLAEDGGPFSDAKSRRWGSAPED